MNTRLLKSFAETWSRLPDEPPEYANCEHPALSFQDADILYCLELAEHDPRARDLYERNLNR